MKVLELFAWSRSIWQVCDELWYECFSTDLTWYDNVNYEVDILKFDTGKVPFVPDVIWASPPCTTFSIAACYHHRKPWHLTEEAKLWDLIVLKTLELIEYYKKINPNLIWYIENPRWLLRKMPFMQYIGIRNTVWYCRYWDNNGKPTDIWSNNKNWKPRPVCRNYKYNKETWEIIDKHCHHEWARRWARTWTQWKKNAHERSKIPEQLCREILQSIIINNK